MSFTKMNTRTYHSKGELERLLDRPIRKAPITYFKQTSVPSWTPNFPTSRKPSSEAELIRWLVGYSNNQNIREVLYLSRESGVPVTTLNMTGSGIEKVAEPKTYSEGRTGADVKNADDSFQVRYDLNSGIQDSYGESPMVFTPVLQQQVLKRNKEKEEDEIEFKLYQKLKELGLPVPDAKLTDEGILIDYVGDRNLAQYVYDEMNVMFMRLFPNRAQRVFSVVEKALIETVKNVSRLDYKLDDILSDEEKTRILKSNYKKIAEKFGVNENIARERYYAFRIFEAIPDCGIEAVPLVDEVESLLNEGLTKFRSWSVDLHPKNVIPTVEEGMIVGIKIIDFNRPKYMMMQEADAMVVDAYLPPRGIDSRPPLMNDNSRERYTSIFDDEFSKRSFVGERLREHFRLTTGKGSFSDEFLSEYLKYFHVARFYTNLRQANYALQELSAAGDFKTMSNKECEVIHYVRNAIQQLRFHGHYFQDDEMHFKDLMGYVAGKYNAVLRDLFPQKVREASEEWFRI